MDLDHAEAALLAHYPRLTRLAYLLLPAALGRPRRVLAAHALVQRALPRGRTGEGRVPGPRTGGEAAREARAADPGYAYVRLRVLTAVLEPDVPRGPFGLPKRSRHPHLLPRVWGLTLFPRSGGSDELALDHALAALPTPARTVVVLRALEELDDHDIRRLLTATGLDPEEAGEALAEADVVRLPQAPAVPVSLRKLLRSPEFDPCTLQARPTDLMSRRRHVRAAAAALVALAACLALLGIPGDWPGAPADTAAPPYAGNEFARAALDPARLHRAGRDDWRGASRPDFAAWPARGSRVDDRALLSRALRVWARPSTRVRLSATPATPSGPPAGPPHLLYAGDLGAITVVVFHDGLRLARYAEPRGRPATGVALDFARTDGADTASATALVIQRLHGRVRYLTAPWVAGLTTRDLRHPTAPPRHLTRDPDGVTEPVDTPAATRGCARWAALELRMREPAATRNQLLTDLGELTPAALSYGAPGTAVPPAGETARAAWARTACDLRRLRTTGVSRVNAWTFAEQELPESAGSAAWICTRAETWRGTDAEVLTHFRPPGTARATLTAQATDTPACGQRRPQALAGVLWKSASNHWYVLAAGSHEITAITATGGVQNTTPGRYLAVPARKGARTELTARLADGSTFHAVR
ncbi:hypothetical protein ACFQLX_23700 [Streptomyces polyrhachis]|uniref:DNA-directed RNA polymerase specialized sigma24 family protein n=1 Tax=Streptomyces polyrhachis TaxID=1282885 RepID=A0ABW2GK41_9ACTN